MKLLWQFGTGAVVLPAALAAHIEKATKRDLRVLFALAAEPTAAVDLAAAVKNAAARLSLSEGEVEAALHFWRGTGVISVTEEEAPATEPATATAPATVIADNDLPRYDTEQLTDLLARRTELGKLIDACQQTFGKIFTTPEVNIIVGMVDYLGFDGEYILLMLAHCVRMEKKSLRYAEKLALSLHDEGVTDARALEERLRRIETMATATGKIRTMFGIANRALSAKEKKMLENWVCNMGYGFDVIERAYEATVDATHEASLAYANTILERWYAAGYKTVEDTEKDAAAHRRAKEGANMSTFDIKEAFDAALKRTYGDNYDGI